MFLFLFFPHFLFALNQIDRQKQQEVHFSIRQAPSNYGAFLCEDFVCFNLLVNVLEPLYTEVENRLEARLAKSHVMSEDGLTHTIHLAKSRWDDGEPVTAFDFEAGFRFVADPKTGAALGDLIAESGIQNARCSLRRTCSVETLGVKALDDETLEIKLERRNDGLKFYLANPIFSPTRLRGVIPDDYGADPLKMRTNGPFRFTSPRKGDLVALEPNPHYTGAKPRVKRVAAVLDSKSSEAKVSALLTGSIDVLDFSDTESRQRCAEKADLLNLASFPENNSHFMTFNQNFEYFRDPLVREWFVQSIRVENLLKSQNGSYAAMSSFLPDVLPVLENRSYARLFKLPSLALSRNRRDELLKQIRRKEKLKKKDILPKKMKLLAYDDPLFVKEVEALQSQIQEMGIEVELEQKNWNAYLQEKDNYPIILAGWRADVLSPNSYLFLFYSTNSVNLIGLKDKVYDALFEQAQKAGSRTASGLFLAAEQYLIENHYVIPIGRKKMFTASSKSLRGVRANADFRKIFWEESNLLVQKKKGSQ